jgi:MFS family permease
MIRDFVEAWPLFSGNARRFLLSATLAGFTYSGVYFLLANLFLARLGYDAAFIGLFIATGAASFAVSSLPAGIMGRRLGPRRSMIGGYLLLMTGLTLLSMAAVVPLAWRSAWLLSCCALREFGNSFYIVNANPFLMETTGEEERRFVFAARGAVVPLAGFFGALAGGVLPIWTATILETNETDPVTFLVPLLFGGCLLLPGWIALLRTQEEVDVQQGAAPNNATTLNNGTTLENTSAPTASVAATAEAERSTPPGDPTVFPLGPVFTMMGVGLLYIAAMSASMSFFNLYMDQELGVSTSRIGSVLAIGQLLAAPAGLMLAPLSARLGYDRTFALSAVGVVLGALLLGLSGTWLMASVGAVTITALSAIAFPAITVYQQELVHPDWRPVMSGAYMMSVALSWSALASGGGYFITEVGYQPLFLLGAALTAAGVVLFSVYARLVRQA